MGFSITWSDRLENLAAAMFSSTTARHDPFETECTVVGSPVMAGWLKQFFLYDYPKLSAGQKVLACWDFRMLHPFVNDWLARACGGTPMGERDAAEHPYSPGVLQWRIWQKLNRRGDYPTLDCYVGDDPRAAERKRWGLAARLTKLFDDYQNCRGDLLLRWQAGETAGLDSNLAWQADLWRALASENRNTYLQQFLDMSGKLEGSGIKETYRRIAVFHTSAMPLAYVRFFRELGTFLDVRMFVFNPSEVFWIEDPTVKQHVHELRKDGDNLAWFDPPHPILGGFGRATQAFLGHVLDETGGQVNDAAWGSNGEASLLQKVQAHIRTRDPGEIADPQDDGSIQFHVCHGPLREVEVVRDLVFKWFAEHPESQPRDVQVLVTDMDTYGPFIESVFRVKDHQPPIPCSISRRPAVSAGAVGTAFVRLMKFHQGRMSAPEAIEILELDPVRERYGLDAGDLSELRGLVNTANIRWGRDRDHVAEALGGEAPMPDTVTWRRGLDRLLAGFAVGRGGEGDDLVEAGRLGSLSVCDAVEGHSAELVGILAQFFEDLCKTADTIAEHSKRKVSEWTGIYAEMVERFFRGTESSFIELAGIRRGIRAVAQAARIAGDPETDIEAVTAAIEAQLGGMEPAGPCDANAVLFSPMRTMQVTPRKLLVVLGMNEGDFPRADQRPAFDLLARKPRYGDRSLRYEDRLAFLEAIMSARERLIITCTGRNISDNNPIPPSPVLTEFRQYLDSFSAQTDGESPRGSLVEPLEHKLHGFNPEYYRQEAGDHRWQNLFSYSRSNHAAARVLACPPAAADRSVATDEPPPGQPPEAGGTPDTAKAPVVTDIDLETLEKFFVNPAQVYFTEILQVRLVDPVRDEVTESEMFDGDNLDEYKVNDIMLKDILGNSSSPEAADFEVGEKYFERLREKALIPLGSFGLGRARQRFFDLKNFLNTRQVNSNHANLYQALLDSRKAGEAPTQITVECGGYRIRGSLPIVVYPENGPEPRTFILRFRFASIKPKDRVRAWLAHVAGHAAGHTFYTDLVGRESKKGDKGMETIKPIDTQIAAQILEDILDLYETGHRQLLPFAPSSSYQYSKILSKKDAASALEAALEKWSGYGYTECRDRYLFAAWKEPGPMEDDQFADKAEAFWKEYFNTVQTEVLKKKAARVGEEDE